MKLCIQMLSRLAEPQFQSGLDPSTHEIIIKILLLLLGRARRWPTPPNWSATLWPEELRQTGFLAALTAEHEHKPSGEDSLVAFIYQRARAGVLACYRTEWTYATRFTAFPLEAEPHDSSTRLFPEPPSPEPGPDQFASVQEVRREPLQVLPEPDRCGWQKPRLPRSR